MPGIPGMGPLGPEGTIAFLGGYETTEIIGACTAIVATGPGVLRGIMVGTPIASSTIDFYDGAGALATHLGKITIPATITSDLPMATAILDIKFYNGLVMVTTGAAGSVTATWRPGSEAPGFDLLREFAPTLAAAFLPGTNMFGVNATSAGGWRPQSGRVAWTVTDLGLRPNFSPTSGPNSTPGLTFVSASSNTLTATGPALTQPLHAFVVAKFTASGSTGTLLDGGTTNRGRIQRTGTTQMTINAGNAVNSSTTPDLTQFHVHEAFFNGAASFYKIDGVQYAAGDAGSTASANGICLGSSAGVADPSDSTISCAVLFNAQLTGNALARFKGMFLTPTFGIPLA